MDSKDEQVVQTGQTHIQIAYKIGDTGQGGGIIFAVEDDTCFEVSPLLGEYTWNDAVQTAKYYRGGGFSDWYLPSKAELNLIYDNLQKTGIVNLGTSYYWSSLQNYRDLVWGQRFSDGLQYSAHKQHTVSVVVVRAFTP